MLQFQISQQKSDKFKDISTQVICFNLHYKYRNKILSMTPRGLNINEAMTYVGVKRRTFDEKWMPRLTTFNNGTSKIIDRVDLDRLFDEFKSDQPNEEKQWPVKQREYKRKATEPLQSTKSSGVSDFATAASKVLKKRMNS
jgi:hypothetical protein